LTSSTNVVQWDGPMKKLKKRILLDPHRYQILAAVKHYLEERAAIADRFARRHARREAENRLRRKQEQEALVLIGVHDTWIKPDDQDLLAAVRRYGRDRGALAKSCLASEQKWWSHNTKRKIASHKIKLSRQGYKDAARRVPGFVEMMLAGGKEAWQYAREVAEWRLTYSAIMQMNGRN